MYFELSAGTDHDEIVDQLARACRHSQSHESPQAVADDCCRLDAPLIEKCADPTSHLINRAKRWSSAAPVTGKVGGQHLAAVIGEVAGKPSPNCVIHTGSMKQDHRWKRRVRIDPTVVNQPLCHTL
jgi:hypothetical protein